jgi:hypothetical protein
LGSGFERPVVTEICSLPPIRLWIWNGTEPAVPAGAVQALGTGLISGRPSVAAVMEAVTFATCPPPKAFSKVTESREKPMASTGTVTWNVTVPIELAGIVRLPDNGETFSVNSPAVPTSHVRFAGVPRVSTTIWS